MNGMYGLLETGFWKCNGWPEKLKVKVEVNPRKKTYVTEVGKLLRWLKKMSVTDCQGRVGATLLSCNTTAKVW